jgi:hypothetical protein
LGDRDINRSPPDREETRGKDHQEEIPDRRGDEGPAEEEEGLPIGLWVLVMIGLPPTPDTISAFLAGACLMMAIDPHTFSTKGRIFIFLLFIINALFAWVI